MLDNILLISLGALSIVALAFAGMALTFAVKSAKKKDAEVQMALWAIAALGGLTLGGMCWAYFLIPILMNKIF